MKKTIGRIKHYARSYIIPVGSDRRKNVVRLYQIFLKDIWQSFKNRKENRQIKQILEKNNSEYFTELPLTNFLTLKDDGRKKILVVPSAYPTKKSPLVGTFFQDQGNVMIPDFDVKVLYGQPKELVGKSLFYDSEGILKDPEGIFFYYDYDPQGSEEDNYGKMVSAYSIILGEMIDQGWIPDILHAQSSVYGGIVANYLGKKFKIPVMLCENMMFLLHNFSKFLQNKIFEAFEEAEMVTPPSTDKMRTILMHGIKCDPVVIGNMVDDDLFQISEKKNNNEVFEILIVAGSSYIKDLHTFFNSIKEIIDRGHDDIHATIIGNGVWGDQSYDSYVKELGIEKYCTFISTVARNDMPRYYNKCDVFVSSSIAEGFQVSIMEAMASGKPVVTTAHGGAEDNMRPENGVVVKIRDYKAIADAIIKIKKHEIEFDPGTIRQTVVEKYGKTAFKEKIANLYNNILDGRE